MRRLMATAAATAVLLSAAGCGSGDSGDAAPQAAASSPSAAASPKAGGNTAKVCKKVDRLNTKSSKKMSGLLKNTFDKALKGEEVSEQELQKATKTMQSTADTWVKGIQQQSAAATDPGLAKALKAYADELKPVQTGDASLEQIRAAVEKSESDLAPYCG